MRVYRICRDAHAATALSGIGAARYPGRWNSTGVHMVYAAGSRSLALLEMLVHLPLSTVPVGMRMLAFELPDDAIHDLDAAVWPEGWNELPYSDRVRRTGDGFARAGQHLALRVPSAIAPGEWNFLVNPRHPRIAEVVLVADTDLVPDSRLFGPR